MDYQNFVLSFREDIYLIEQSEEEIIVQSDVARFSIKNLTPGLLSVIRILASSSGSEEKLCNLVFQTDGTHKLPLFYYYLNQFNSKSLLCHSVTLQGFVLAKIIPISPYYKFHKKQIEFDKKYILSRFAYCRRDKANIVLESPLSYAKIILYDRRVTDLIQELAKPQDYYQLCSKISEIPEQTSSELLQLLLNAEAISIVKENGVVEEEENLALTQWEFHDLLFHSRTRQGRHTNPFGAGYRFIDRIESLPPVKPKMSNEIIELYKPDIENLKQADISFSLVLEERKSIRNYADQPITDKQLGEFLYRTARVREIIQTDTGYVSNRPYPCGGAIYELELYIIVNTCENIASGLYHYYPLEHQLCKLSDRNEYVEALLLEASISAARICTPQILITFAARFQRMSWKYNSMAYAAILKNVGVLYQTMYLVATAMNIAPCGLGCGNSDLFVRAVGTDYYAETSVGEFMLGSKQGL
jgi:oxazoline/thiazoline dehydrogenase